MEIVSIEDGKVIIKRVTEQYEDSLENFLEKITERKIKTLETGYLPLNTLKVLQKEDETTYYIYLPAGSYKLKYNKTLYDVVMPNSVFKIVTNKGCLKSQHYYWTLSDKPELEKEIWKVPTISNVYNDCSLCIGETKFDSSDNDKELVDNFIKAFFEGEFNNDLLKADYLNIDAISKEQQEALENGASLQELIDLWYEEDGSLRDIDSRYHEEFSIEE